MRLKAAKVFIALVIPLVVFSHHVYSEGGALNLGMETLGCAALFLAAVGRIWAAAYIAGKKNREVVASGPYSVSRHPLYFFTALGFIGTGLALESLTLTAIFLGIFVITHWPAMRREERHLSDSFGEKYQAYARATPRWLPRWWKFHSPAEGTIDYSVFSRAVLDAALIGLIYPGAQILEWAHVHHFVPVLFRLY
ncbi:isoprenylcysteine carboxylmethyltransferase family protein [Thermogutta sp.]|jgi:protein-S-isoprenylcysteine O-methyltransferase Ste14|uniref:methyltransferase family protein n=1 Tax=Thermogutta sp. TaxID=1962930 RepID=UPI00321FD949